MLCISNLTLDECARMARSNALRLSRLLYSPPVNYRYTVVLQSKLGEWPPPVTQAIPRMDIEARWEEYNRRQREIRQQAKERGLCTRCYREPAMPNMALCEQCYEKRRQYRAASKLQDGELVPEKQANGTAKPPHRSPEYALP